MTRVHEYIRRRIDFRRQVAEHRRTAPPDCPCVHCAGVDAVHKRLMERAREGRAEADEIRF